MVPVHGESRGTFCKTVSRHYPCQSTFGGRRHGSLRRGPTLGSVQKGPVEGRLLTTSRIKKKEDM